MWRAYMKVPEIYTHSSNHNFVKYIPSLESISNPHKFICEAKKCEETLTSNATQEEYQRKIYTI